MQYPANWECSSKYFGINDTIKHLHTQSAACPGQVFALVGYSQGADVIHGAAKQLSEHIKSHIVALTLFGDPGNRGPNETSPLGGSTPVFSPILADRLKQNCATGDPVCSNAGVEILAHLSYSSANTTFIADSANYIVSQYKSKGCSGPQPAAYGGPGPNQPTQPTKDNIAALQKLGALLGQNVTCVAIPSK
jgi:cutinase